MRKVKGILGIIPVQKLLRHEFSAPYKKYLWWPSSDQDVDLRGQRCLARVCFFIAAWTDPCSHLKTLLLLTGLLSICCLSYALTQENKIAKELTASKMQGRW